MSLNRIEKRKLAGKCSRCDEPPRVGRILCQKCADKDKERLKKRYDFLKINNLCVVCYNPCSSELIHCYKCSINVRVCRKSTLSKKEKDKAKEASRDFDGRCQCCGTIKPGGYGDFHIDHKDDKFRGIICSSCNTSLGLLNDSEQR